MKGRKMSEKIDAVVELLTTMVTVITIGVMVTLLVKDVTIGLTVAFIVVIYIELTRIRGLLEETLEEIKNRGGQSGEYRPRY